VNQPGKRKSVTALRPVSDHIAETLKKRILGGDLAEQTRLRQDALASEFGVSHIPVREALRQLAAEGLVTIRPHQGATVSTLSAAEAQELLEMRSVLELQALRWALPHAGEDVVRRAEASLEQAERCDDVSQWMQANWTFHSTLYESAGRPRLSAMIQSLDQQIDRFVRVLVSSSDYRRSAEAEHRAILAAYRVRNIEAVVCLAQQHLSETTNALAALLKHHRNNGTDT
jgi:DNA-binding GntR family transcriptional regulator